MSTHLRHIAEFEVDDTDERMCGMQPPTLDELREWDLDREDREADHFPPSAAHWMTPPRERVLDQAPRHLPPAGRQTLTGTP